MSEKNIIVICISLVALSVIAASTVYNLNDRKLMAENINKAIEKGVDPMSVRCSYATERDVICVAYAAASQTHNSNSPLVKK